MSDLVDRIRTELDARIERLRPVIDELERLERAAVALAHAGARAVPGLGARPSAPAPASPERTPPTRAARAKPAARRPPAQRRGTASKSTPAPADAKPQRRPAGRSPRVTPTARKPPVGPASAASGRRSAPRGQTQAKILAALHAAPGSTTAAIAAAAGVPTNTAAATISRLVKQGRVHRLEAGGYAAAETPAGPAQIAAARSDTPGTAPPPTATGGERSQ
jgi:hypothetical protein